MGVFTNLFQDEIDFIEEKYKIKIFIKIIRLRIVILLVRFVSEIEKIIVEVLSIISGILVNLIVQNGFD